MTTPRKGTALASVAVASIGTPRMDFSLAYVLAIPKPPDGNQESEATHRSKNHQNQRGAALYTRTLDMTRGGAARWPGLG